MFFAQTIEGLGKDSGSAGLARTSGSSEQVGGCNPLLSNGIAQGLLNRGLSDQILKRLGSVCQMEGSSHNFGGVKIKVAAPVGEVTLEHFYRQMVR